ncbi:MAG TPA: CapA family protein [Ilumatobacter sp.]
MKLCLAGDTMLGRKVAERLARVPPAALFADGVVGAAREADLFVLNLECAISDRGERWPDPFKPFFFRAPPIAVEVLRYLGVGCVTLANNHALDFGTVALLDTLRHLAAAGIESVGAGVDERAARAPVVIERGGVRIGIIAVTDHPADFAASADRPGVAYAELRRGIPEWLRDSIANVDADIVVVTPHWGPNMVAEPVAHVRSAAAALQDAGADLIAGHSAHVFHGAAHRLLYDLGDFIDDYAREPELRNELSLLWLVTIEASMPARVEAVPLALDYCHTRLANPHEAAWIRNRFRRACAAMGTDVQEEGGRLVVEWPRGDGTATSPRSSRAAAARTWT